MIRTREINNKTVFYESVTGATIQNLTAVSFPRKPDIVSTVVTKNAEWYVYFPDDALFDLHKLKLLNKLKVDWDLEPIRAEVEK